MQTLSAQRIKAVISRFGKTQQSHYPPYARVQSVLFTWESQGQTQEVWKTFPADEARLFKTGQPVLLSSRTGVNNQLIWEVEFIDATPAASPPPAATYTAPEIAQYASPATAQFTPTAPAPYASQPVTHQPPAPVAPVGQPNQALAQWIHNQAELYAHCFGSAAQALTAYEVSEETIRAAASTLFISASRKFNLER